MGLSAKQRDRLREKYGAWALVTGASSGIGLALATELARAGFNLLLNARNLDKWKDAEPEMAHRWGIEIRMIEADLSEMAGLEKLITAAKHLEIGLVINNAGFGTSGQFLKNAVETEMDMLRLNCAAVLYLTHYFCQKFLEQKRGGFIFLSSLVAFQGVPFAANYAATKAYVQSFAEALSVELKAFNIDVLYATPGPVDSGFGERAGMRMNRASRPSQISVPILAALGKGPMVVPGVYAKILLYSLRILPRFVRTKILRGIMEGFTRHQLTD
ncbi:MAG TPA: SDR family NAD(P)-dependent oxidoreductase [Sediminibacterium sp.]|nr:SDR family NAD(P)-dependent oxidoreductase [Sediminibacterium sp.]